MIGLSWQIDQGGRAVPVDRLVPHEAFFHFYQLLIFLFLTFFLMLSNREEIQYDDSVYTRAT